MLQIGSDDPNKCIWYRSHIYRVRPFKSYGIASPHRSTPNTYSNVLSAPGKYLLVVLVILNYVVALNAIRWVRSQGHRVTHTKAKGSEGTVDQLVGGTSKSLLFQVPLWPFSLAKEQGFAGTTNQLIELPAKPFQQGGTSVYIPYT